MKRVLVVLAAAASVGCAWEPGGAFATLSSASIAASLELDEPLVSAGGEAITLSSLELDVESIELRGLGAPSTEIEHEHGEKEAAESEALAYTVATVHVERTLDWLAGTPVDVSSVEPSRELPEAELHSVVVNVTALRLRGEVGGEELDIELPESLILSGPLDFVIDRDAPERLSLSVSIEQSALLFSGLDAESLEHNLAESHVHATIDEER